MKRIQGRHAVQASPPASPDPVRHCRDTRPVGPPAPDAERRAHEDVRARLTRRFPEVPAQVLEQMVAEEFASFTGARVRHYVPVLVFRRVGEQLTGLGWTERADRVGAAPGPGREDEQE